MVLCKWELLSKLLQNSTASFIILNIHKCFETMLLYNTRHTPKLCLNKVI